jgi:hypothetical protein
MDVKLAQFIIGALLGTGLYAAMKRGGLSITDPATRNKAILVIVGFSAAAALLLELTDYLTR